ncbi:response regulator [Chitinimonas sp.]|uniref:response regulator n=1 Tax=Chitinimonas sp. TaxID=1934313 RepID=UPI0035AF69C2
MRLIIADDHVIFREGLKLLLSHAGYTVVAEAGDAGSLRELVREHGPELVILDYHMPGNDSAAVLAYLKQRYPELKVIMLTAAQSGTLLKQLADAGADGVLLKEGSATLLLDALRRVLAGERVIAKAATERIKDATVALTAREFQILHLICAGESSTAIAERLTLSPRTVEKHRENLFRKLEVNNVAQLINKAETLNLLQ